MLPLEDVNLNDVGLTAAFVCEVSKEGLKAEWLKADKPLKSSKKVSITCKGTSYRLEINDCGADDEGNYSIVFKECDVKTTAKLSVKGEYIVDLLK